MNTATITTPMAQDLKSGQIVPARHIGKAKKIPADPTRYGLPYQHNWIYDKSRLKLWVKSRQIGGSLASQIATVRNKAFENCPIDTFVASSNEGQACLYLEGCHRYAKQLHIEAINEGKMVIDEDGSTAYVLRFANGRRIFSMSSSVNAQAGKTGDRIIDEFATIPHARELYGVAFPGTMWNGSKLEIISTQRGRDTYFNELIQEIEHGGNPKRFSFHKVTFEDALKEGLLYKLQMNAPEEDVIQGMDEADYFNYIRASCPDEEFFLQEYMCVASDMRTAFLSHDLIVSCEYAAGEKWELSEDIIANSQNKFFVGMDIAREKDLTVIWLLEQVGDVLHTRAVEVMEKESFDAQEEALDVLMQWSRVKRVCIDNTGIGRQFAERARQRYGDYRVEAVTFTAEVKEEMAYPLRTAFERRTIRIPNENAIRADLRSVRKEITASGNVRFSAGRSENGHADRFWALALAHEAARTYIGEPSASVA
jgi:phage FluMu gp28-like protein